MKLSLKTLLAKLRKWLFRNLTKEDRAEAQIW
jgi:hypothetical protein